MKTALSLLGLRWEINAITVWRRTEIIPTDDTSQADSQSEDGTKNSNIFLKKKRSMQNSTYSRQLRKVCMHLQCTASLQWHWDAAVMVVLAHWPWQVSIVLSLRTRTTLELFLCQRERRNIHQFPDCATRAQSRKSVQLSIARKLQNIYMYIERRIDQRREKRFCIFIYPPVDTFDTPLCLSVCLSLYFVRSSAVSRISIQTIRIQRHCAKVVVARLHYYWIEWHGTCQRVNRADRRDEHAA